MPELRQNVATREWVIIATERAQRPDQFVDARRALAESRPRFVADCPFCPGNEALVGKPSLEISEAGRWQVRVVANKFPALVESGEPVRHFKGVERSMDGFGVHEVLIESPLHNATTALQSEQEVGRTLRAFCERGRKLSHDERLLLTIFFKNHGAGAGTSLEHPHSQMVSLPVVPHHVRQRLQDAAAYYDEHGSCVFCDMWHQELAKGARVIVEGKHSLAFVPYAAFSPFHTWVVPKRHMAVFGHARDEELDDVAAVLRGVLRRMYFGLHDPDFNFVVRTAPNQEDRSRSFHWYISIVPRVTRTAGFEVGSGMFINTALPEDSAKFLREVKTP
ncbi:MAG TPA: galactose-1-phosphate uridylyltransferase [Myxococcales bacterium]|jgi:UDPglucose--hexose-1-phosphate uridylyltransferase